MSECNDHTMQDRLPALARGQLSAADAGDLRTHLASCADCAAEFAILQRAGRLFDHATPRLDVEAIVAKLPAPPSVRPALRVERGESRRLGLPRYALAAAASLLLVATLSLSVLRPVFFNQPSATVDVALADGGLRTLPPLPTALVGGTDLADFDADELAILLADLDRIEATVASEPMALRQPVTPVPEEL